jgi:hypothetical protein
MVSLTGILMLKKSTRKHLADRVIKVRRREAAESQTQMESFDVIFKAKTPVSS